MYINDFLPFLELFVALKIKENYSNFEHHVKSRGVNSAIFIKHKRL